MTITLFAPYEVPQPERIRVECEHVHLEFRQYKFSDDTIRYLYECQDCGSKRHPMLGLRRAMLEWGKTKEECQNAIDVDLTVNTEEIDRKRDQTRDVNKEARKYWYQCYLLSEQWKTRRSAVMARDNHMCQYCGGEATEVHHLTYENIGNEPLEELIAICRMCHEDQHSK
jgi:hypothetical protein